MEKSEVVDSKKKNWKLIFALLGVVLGVLVIVSLIKFGTVLFFVPFWFWIVDKIIELTGANLWLARGFAALSVIPFFYLIKLIFSWKPEKRKVGWILLSILTASLCFMMFFLSEDIYFSFKTGQAQKWYIVTPEGEYKFSDSPGYNTLWGIQYQKVTPAVIKKYIGQEKGRGVTKKSMEKGEKEIIPVIPKKNIPKRTVKKAIPEKKITTQQTIPKEITPERTTKKIITKETTPKKVTSRRTAERRISEKKKVTEKPAGGREKEIASKKPIFKIIPKKITSKKIKSFSLSLEEEKLLVEELKKHLCPGYKEEVKKLFGILELLEESGSLFKYNDLLCALVKENINYGGILRVLASKKAIYYLAKIGSVKSIPTLLWAFANADDLSERKMARKAIKIIKGEKGINLEPPSLDELKNIIIVHPQNKGGQSLGGSATFHKIR